MWRRSGGADRAAGRKVRRVGAACAVFLASTGAAQTGSPRTAPPALEAPPPPPPGSVAGTILLLGADGVSQPGANAVVWLPGVTPAARPAPRMASKAKRFSPHLQVVPRGGSVVFPNLDRIYHNVFSTTAGQGFDLGLYRNGASRQHRFERSGLVTVYCNIHPQMVGFVRVVDGAWAETDAAGAFRIADVPPARYRVKAWHERGGEHEISTVVRSAQRSNVRLVLDATRYRRQPHKNKHGQDYPPATLDDDRY